MEAKSTPSIIGRSNTVFGSLKSWASTSFSGNARKNAPLGGCNASSANNPNNNNASSSSSSASTSSKKATGCTKSNFGSVAIAVHKLRESRWFGEAESRLFCAVVESGFVVEIKAEGQENDSTFGVVQFKCAKGSCVCV